jgi:hypothetical protein
MLSSHGIGMTRRERREPIKEVCMAVLDDVMGLLKQYAGGKAPKGDVHGHFQQVAQTVDSDAMAGGIAAMLRSDQTPPFADLVSQLFVSGSGDQKAAMFKTLVSAVPAEQRAKIASIVPGLSDLIANPASAATARISPAAIQQLAQHAERQDPSVVDKMSAFYAAHPTLIKTLGATAMTIAMRAIADHGRKT